MSISVFDLFSVGIGPSSSHTVGPMRAATQFLQALQEQRLLQKTQRINVQLYGSLSATGIGHGTDRAIILGLTGKHPESITPQEVTSILDSVDQQQQLPLNGHHTIDYIHARDMCFSEKSLPYHANSMILSAYNETMTLHYRNTYYSIGGGFILDEAGIEQQQSNKQEQSTTTHVKYPFDNAHELLQQCKHSQLSISQLMRANETTWRSEHEIDKKLMHLWQVMQECVHNGLNNKGKLPGGLNVKRRAAELHHSLMNTDRTDIIASNAISNNLEAMDWLNLYALAVNEENAAGGRVVTAPTNGAAGIIPAVLHYYQQFCHGANNKGITNFLLAAAAIGILCKKNASISGAEVGCQGEVGSACAMAAAGLTEALGGSPEQVEHAAEIGLEHNLGLTCDPVGGLVQIPCIERNAIAAVKAVNAAQMALRNNGGHIVSLDQVIRTMRDTGADMHDKYKETSRGGLAVNIVAC